MEVYLKEQNRTGQREREMASRQQLAEGGIATGKEMVYGEVTFNAWDPVYIVDSVGRSRGSHMTSVVVMLLSFGTIYGMWLYMFRR